MPSPARICACGGLSDMTDLALSPDGRLLAASGKEEVCLWETATGTLLARLPGHRGQVQAVAFSGDGRTLATGGDDSTVLLWDVASLVRRPRGPSQRRQNLARLWDQLANEDAGGAYDAAAQLAQVPGLAVKLLRERMKPAVRPAEARLAQLIMDLDSDSFATRQRAGVELERLGSLAEAKLRQTLASKPSAEVQQKAERLLRKLDGPSTLPDQVRELCAVELLERLEWLGTPEARVLLHELAKGVPEACLTREARTALERSGSQHGSP